MPKLTLYNRDGEEVSEVEVRAELFAAPIKKGALYHTAVAQRARRRQGTAATKGRSFVRGGGAKPWPQKDWQSPPWQHPFSDLGGRRRYLWASSTQFRLQGSKENTPGGILFSLECQGPGR